MWWTNFKANLASDVVWSLVSMAIAAVLIVLQHKLQARRIAKLQAEACSRNAHGPVRCPHCPRCQQPLSPYRAERAELCYRADEYCGACAMGLHGRLGLVDDDPIDAKEEVPQ